eukprot:5666688-Prymnesium_polylepis.1
MVSKCAHGPFKRTATSLENASRNNTQPHQSGTVAPSSSEYRGCRSFIVSPSSTRMPLTVPARFALMSSDT